MQIISNQHLFILCRDGRAQVSRKIIHTSEPNIDNRAPDKYLSSWYNRVNIRSQGNTDFDGFNAEQNRERDQNRPIQPFATSSNLTEAVVKFGF